VKLPDITGNLYWLLLCTNCLYHHVHHKHCLWHTRCSVISSVDCAEGDASIYIKILMLLTLLVTHTVMKVT